MAVNANTVVVSGTGQASTHYVIPHGCRGVPAFFACQGLGSAASVGVNYGVLLDATNASVNFATGLTSGSNNASIMWFAMEYS